MIMFGLPLIYSQMNDAICDHASYAIYVCLIGIDTFCLDSHLSHSENYSRNCSTDAFYDDPFSFYGVWIWNFVYLSLSEEEYERLLLLRYL